MIDIQQTNIYTDETQLGLEFEVVAHSLSFLDDSLDLFNSLFLHLLCHIFDRDVRVADLVFHFNRIWRLSQFI